MSDPHHYMKEAVSNLEKFTEALLNEKMKKLEARIDKLEEK
jgi:hypothetical protein